MPDPGSVPTRLGNYEIRGTLGFGALGAVYDGWDPLIGRRVAIKTVLLSHLSEPEAQEGLARFRREAQAVGRLSHPNVISVHDYGETESTAYLVLEFVAGRSLKEWLDAGQRFAPAVAVGILQQLLAALEACHAAGVVHRDITPGNILLTADGQVKLGDFGGALIESDSSARDGALPGTPAYMSPEQLTADAVDARSDLYAAGVVLYQLLAGERPFRGSLAAVTHKALHDVPPCPSELAAAAPPALDAVVARAMARRRADRYPSAAAFAAALDAAWQAAERHAAAASPLAAASPAAVPPRRPAENAGGGRLALLPHGRPPLETLMPSLSWRVGWMAGGVVAALLLVAVGFELGRGRPAGTTAELAASTAAAVSPPAIEAAGAVPAAPAGTSPGVAATDVTDSAAAPPPAAGGLAPAVQQAPPPARFTAPAAAAPATGGLSAPLAAASVAEALAALDRTARCAVPRLDLSASGGVDVAGLVGAGAPAAALRQAVQAAAHGAPLSWNVTDVEGPFCAALDLIRPLAVPNSMGVTLDLGLQGGVLRLHENDAIVPILRLPAYPAYLQVDALGPDGTVRHLYPTDATPDRPLPKAATIRLPEEARTSWQAGPPFGTSVIIAVAASVPLFTLRRHGADDTALSYLPALQAAIEAARRQNAQVIGQAVALQILPK